jgi:superfamily II DNA helicase RecQ
MFTVPIVDSAESEEALNRFLRGHRILSVERELARLDGAVFWCFCIEYLEGAGGVDRKGRSARVDYKEVLSEEDFAVFARLREARKRLAEAEAVPVYAVCTNEQLAEMARRRVSTVEDVRKVDGIGEAKATKYGQALVEAIMGRQGGEDEARGRPV